MTNTHDVEAGVFPGEVLAGKYQVERVLGVGGMGVVVAAHHIQLDTKVAIKLLLPSMLSNREAVARFAREARAAVRITSEHVARIIDVGALETGAPYMVMEYLEGGDLAAWLRQRGPLPIEQAVEFVLHACVAVAEAHGLGIVHRDLKPANLFCVRRADGLLSIKVLDFGISKVSDGARGSEPPGLSVTKTSAIMGSPLYMSPEQMQSAKSVDAQSDIWALGVILYELLAGRLPFEGEAATEVAIRVVMEPPAPLRSFRPDVPPGLEAVVLKCLEKDRRNRHLNVAELAFGLAEFAPRRARGSIERITDTIRAAGLSVSALAMPPSPQGQGTVLSPETIAPVGQTTPTFHAGSPRIGLVVGVATAVILLVGGAGVVLARLGANSHPVAASSNNGMTLPAVSFPPAQSGPVAIPAPPASDSASAATVVAAAPPAAQSAVSPSHPVPRATGTLRAPPAAPPSAQGQGVSQSCEPPFTVTVHGRRSVVGPFRTV